MTNTTFQQPDTSSPFADAEAKSSQKRTLIIAGAGAGVLVLAGAGFLLLHGGSSSGGSNLVTPAPHLVVHKATSVVSSGKRAIKGPAKTGKPAGTSALPAATNVRVGRDPFKALYVVPTGGSGGSSSSSTASTSSTTPSTTTSTGSTSTSTTSATSTAASTAPYVLTLKSITTSGGAKLYTFTYNKQTKTVLTAQRFGKYGELVVLDYLKNSQGQITGAVIQVGDDNPVELSIAEKISVE